MAKERVTVTIDEGLMEVLKELLGPRTVSSFVNDAVYRRVQALSIKQMLDEMDEECGPVPDDVAVEVDRDLDAFFFGDRDA